MTYDHQSLIVLPSIRLNRLRSAIQDVILMEQGGATATGMINDIMAAIEQHLEAGAYRWGNACPETHEQVIAHTNGGWNCPVHGYHRSDEPMELLIAFKPSVLS